MTLTVENPVAIPLLLGLWMEADDDGVFEWKPLTLKAKALPAAAVDINDLLGVLSDLNFLRKFDVDGKAFGAIRNFKHWQRPKLPKVKWPKASGIAAYVGDTSPSLTQHLPIDGEKSGQREEGGGDDEGGSSSLRSESIEKKERERADFDSWISSWPSQASDDHDDAFRAWSELSDEERAEAQRLSSAYVEQAKGGGRTVICSAAKYLRQRMWKRVQSKPPDKPPKIGAKPQTREEYLAAEMRRSERSFQR